MGGWGEGGMKGGRMGRGRDEERVGRWGEWEVRREGEEWGVWRVGDEGINTTQTQLQGFDTNGRKIFADVLTERSS